MYDYALILLLFVAPIMQIILSILRYRQKIKLHPIIIAAFSLLVGIVLSIISASVFLRSTPPCKGCIEGPGVIGIYMGIIGVTISGIATPLIGVFFYLICWHKQSKNTPTV